LTRNACMTMIYNTKTNKSSLQEEGFDVLNWLICPLPAPVSFQKKSLVHTAFYQIQSVTPIFFLFFYHTQQEREGLMMIAT
jgi:hypothetical protein